MPSALSLLLATAHLPSHSLASASSVPPPLLVPDSPLRKKPISAT